MSQLVVRPGRNAARQAKKLKEIRKVKGAIVWHERERKKRQELFQERWDSKQAHNQRIKWENDNVRAVKKKALLNAKEDWLLGPLRPNRAIGEDADKYGALGSGRLQQADIPVHSQRNRNEARERRNEREPRERNRLDLDPPLIVDDEKYFHIEKDDRVIVIAGREKDRIGVVQEIFPRTHEVSVKDINLQYYDADLFNNTGDDVGSKRKSEVPIPMSDVRLVVPYEFVETNGAKIYRDVIVDKVRMVRHTTGIDPFTGTDYGNAEIPKDHQYDPNTGLPIFHRYIAGTQHRIGWPWEKDDIAGEKPKSKDPGLAEAYDNDTTVNIVEGGESMSYTLIDPPFPDTLREEIRSNIKEFAVESSKGIKKDAKEAKDAREKAEKDGEEYADEDAAPPRPVKPKRVTEQGIKARELVKARHAAAQKMKTPMQLRWEQEHAKKLLSQKKAPLVTTDALMAALDEHLQKTKAVKRSQRVAKVEELD